jgi:predicted TIM-barrel fold metal-dependent hydrolase
VSGIVISADSHVIEPHDLWQRYVPAAYKERAPRLVHTETTDVLEFAEGSLPPVGLLAGCARADDEVRVEGRWEEDVFVGGYDPDVRMQDLKRDGVAGEILYPTIAMQLYPVQDYEFQRVLFQAYNEWLGQEFCAEHPDRLKGIALLSADDVDVAIGELKRAKDLGLVGVMLPLFPGEGTSYADRSLDPLWAAAVEHGMPIHLHAATTRDASKAWDKVTPTGAVLKTMEAQAALLDIVLRGVFDRFPEMTVVSAESDAGWAGNVVERADFWWHRSRNITGRRARVCENPPSEYFHKNVKMTFMRDHTAVLARDIIGLDSLLWGNDFPHHVSTWPNSQAVLAEHFDDQPAEVRDAIVRKNATELYGFPADLQPIA